MYRNGRNSRCKSANMKRCRENKLHVVELTLSDVSPVNMSPPAKFENYIKQQENSHRPGTAFTEIIFDDARPLPHYPSDNALNVEGEIYDDHLHSANVLNNQRKSLRNSRHQVAPDSDNSNRPVRPYRPISSHQYLTSTELKDSTINDKNVHLGRPTRTTLLRERQRRRSVPAVDVSHHLLLKAGQKQDSRTPTRYEAVKNILSSMIPAGQSLHSFLCGARYNRSNWIETIGSLDLASDLPAMGGSSLNSTHQRQRPMSEQLDVDYMPRAPPDSPVDFNNTTVRDGCTGTFLPALSGPGSAEPTSPLPKQASENRSRKIAWEEEIKRLSPLPDRAASTSQEKVRFQTEEPVAGGNVHAVHHERTHHAVRPSSVRAPPTTQVVKPGRDMAAVVVHGISLHGAPSARDAPHTLAEQPSNGMRRSWSATTYTASGSRPPLMDFNRLDALKVTGTKVSGTPDTGRIGLRLSALKRWRLENDAESTEALVGSRCERLSEQEMVGNTAEHTAVPSGRSTPNKEADHELNFNEDVGHEIEFNEDVNHEMNSTEDHRINQNKESDHEIDSYEDVNHEINYNEDVDQEIKFNKVADFDVDPSKESDHKIRSNNEVDHEIISTKEVDHEGVVVNTEIGSNRKDIRKTDSEMIESNRGKPPPSSIELRRLSPDQLSETNESFENDRNDLERGSREQGRANLGKVDQVYLPNKSKDQSNVTVVEVGQVSTGDVFEELGQVNTRDQSAEQGQVEPAELGQASVRNESAEEGDIPRQASADDGKNSGDEGKEAAEEGVVFFITEEQLNKDSGCHDDRVTKENNGDEKEEEEFNNDGARKEIVNNFSEEGIAEDIDVVSARSVISPDGGTMEAAEHWSVGHRN